MARPSKKQQRIDSVEAEFDQPIEVILRDFAIDHSYTFTTQALNLTRTDIEEYKYLFTYKRGAGKNPNSHKRNNTHKQTAEELGITTSGYKWRRDNWPKDRWTIPKQPRGNAENFGNNRNVATWREQIHNHANEVIQRREST